MNSVALICSLIATFSCAKPNCINGVKSAEMLLSEDLAVVAVLTDAIPSYEKKQITLQEYADYLSEQYGVKVELTTDMLTYCTIKRMRKIGISNDQCEKIFTQVNRKRNTIFSH